MENYIRECARRLEERTKGLNGRDKNSRLSRHSIESGRNEASE